MRLPAAPEFLVRFPAPSSGQGSVGAGFVVSDHHVLTCAHVVNAALGRGQLDQERPSADDVLLLRLPLRGDAIRQARVVEWLPPPSRGIAGGDIAGLEIIGEPLPANLMAARLADWTSLGDKADVFGYPVEKNRPAGGWVPCHVRGRVGNGLLQIDSDPDAALRTQPGYSGSPIIERVSGAVIGMFSAASYNSHDRDSYGIPSVVLRSAWEDVLGLVPPCPYRPLAPFDERDHAVFFGRGHDTDRLLAAVQRSPLVVVIGPSGVGKSSLVQAGLVPALRASGTWTVTQCRPGRGRPFRPFRELAGALFRAEEFLETSVSDLRSRESELTAGGLPELLTTISSARNRRVLVILEQMEEIFTTGYDPSVAGIFLDSILALPDQLGHSGGATLVATLRADFNEYLLQRADAAQRLDGRVVSLSPLGPTGLRQVVEEPALKLSVSFESGLIDRIIKDASNEAGALPLLQFTLSELWAMQRRQSISHQSYTEIGGLEGGLRTHAEDVIATLLSDGTSELTLRRALLSLINRTGDGVLTTRRTCRPTQLPPDQQAVINALTAARLVTTDHDHDGPRAELAHEVLIRMWPRLAELAEEEAAFVRWRSEIEQWQKQWQKKRYGLLSDPMLAEARRWCDERPEETLSILKLVEHSEAAQALTGSKAQFRAVFTDATLGIGIADMENNITDANPALQRMFGYTLEELTQRKVTEMVHPEDAPSMWETHSALVRGELDHFRMEKRFYRSDGGEIWTDLTVSLVRDEAGEPAYQVALLEDVSERHRLQDKLEYQAYHDPLTGLANRARVTEWLDQIFDGPAGQRRVGLCFLDLDGFKAVNDSLGHDVGDQLLIAVASRLTSCCGTGQLVARMGGDEFVIIIDDTAGEADVTELADKVLAAMAVPVRVGGQKLTVTMSIGVIERPVADTNPADLLQAADITLYRAKAEGKARYAMFDQYRNDSEVARSRFSTTMLAAVERGEFFIDYQPLVGLADGALCGVEALVRWRHPTFGVLGPERFIDLAEESGSIVQLGHWVLTRACEQARAWQDAFGDAAPLVSVNLAPRQLHEPTLVAEVSAILAGNGLDPSRLQLELTEQSVLGEEAGPLKMLTTLYAMGVRIAIDDFGAGFWNLPDLRRLPMHELKLAGSFAVGLQSPSDLVDQQIVAALVDLAHALKLTVTAKNVETLAQLERFRALGCDAGQGTLFGLPSTAEQIDDRLRAAIPFGDPDSGTNA
jgi:diguanylate cyclase (GGDEF)-like protein/PAS domain S-box-containing protein